MLGLPTNPTPGQEFSLSVVQYVSGLIIATALLAREDDSFIRTGPLSKAIIKENQDTSLTKILRTDKRIGKESVALLFRRENTDLIKPYQQEFLTQVGSYDTIHQLVVWNTKEGLSFDEQRDVICYLYDDFTKEQLRYSMGISPVWFQEEKNVQPSVMHALPSDVLFEANMKPNNLPGPAVRVIDGKPVGINNSSSFIINKLPQGSVYRVAPNNQVILGYSAKTSAYHEGKKLF